MFRKPCQQELTQKDQITINWLTVCYYGWQWSSGYTHLAYLLKILQDITRGATWVICKDAIKTKDIFKCEVLGVCESIPSLKTNRLLSHSS